MVPSLSLDAEPSNRHERSVHELVNCAVGRTFAAKPVATTVSVAVAPWSSVTVTVAVYVPLAAKVCEVVTPEPVAPSPKFQSYDAIVPSRSPEPDAPKVQTRFEHVTVAAAVDRKSTRLNSSHT